MKKDKPKPQPKQEPKRNAAEDQRAVQNLREAVMGRLTKR